MEFRKVAGDKTNTQNHSHSYTLAMTIREIKGPIPVTTATKRIEYLGINSPKETQELYTENYKTPMKEIKDDINGERFHVPG